MTAYWLTFLSRITSSSSKTSFASLTRITFPTANVICGIIASISAVDRAIALSPAERDIDPGIATRRRLCTTQTRRSPEILGIFQGNERHVLRVVRTRLGAPSRDLVVISSPPKATGEYKTRE